MLPMPTLVVTNPMLSGPLLITNTSVEFCPKNGNLNSFTRGVLPTSKRFAPFLLFNITFWPVINGWFGKWRVLVGIEIFFLIFLIMAKYIERLKEIVKIKKFDSNQPIGAWIFVVILNIVGFAGYFYLKVNHIQLGS